MDAAAIRDHARTIRRLAGEFVVARSAASRTADPLGGRVADAYVAMRRAVEAFRYNLPDGTPAIAAKIGALDTLVVNRAIPDVCIADLVWALDNLDAAIADTFSKEIP